MKRFIENTLESNWLWWVARLLILAMFIASGLAKLIDFEGGMAVMREAELHPDWLFNIATIVVLLAGSILILSDRLVWLGAGMLSVFLILIIFLVHTFWLFSGEKAENALNFVFEDIAVIGGLIAVAIISHLRKKLKA
ncbi:DoxX family protein [Xenorhabdus sp. 12]|uniref:DoxX family protein n=2 Tax=Xenorhabdus santafensis TaxID=2582833 RepID=A0ABU4S3X3_9GAMM|nr:DoxX family protein [Xenorhabdus sp. 12]